MIPLSFIHKVTCVSNQPNIFSTISRTCANLSIAKTLLEVPLFCDLNVDLPCKVRVKPLNIHKYHNLNQFVLQFDQKFENGIEHYVDGNKINIIGNEKLSPNTLCSIKAPVKSNLNITAKNDVTVGFFQGDKIKIKSTEGNIFVDRFQGESIDVSTINGNITLNNYIQASNIWASSMNGCISTGRLQGLNLKLKICKGDLSVESSYCAETIFVVEKGKMNLNNIHKNCKIFLIKGDLALTGFDGSLSAILTSGSADIYLTRITGDSEISIKDFGNINLKITDSCQDYSEFKVVSQDILLAENLRSKITKNEDIVILKPDGDPENVVSVNTTNGSVKIESTSWQDMIKMRLKVK